MRKHKKFKNFKRKIKRALCTVLSAAMLSGSGAAAPPVTAQAAATVTVERFNDMLKNVCMDRIGCLLRQQGSTDQ